MIPIAVCRDLCGSLLASGGHSSWSDWGALEWAIAVVGGAISVWVIWLAVRHTFRPGEEASDHVKRSILEDEDRALGASPDVSSELSPQPSTSSPSHLPPSPPPPPPPLPPPPP